MLINNKEYYPTLHASCTQCETKHRLICQLLIYIRLHQCLRILDVYRKLVASIPFILEWTTSLDTSSRTLFVCRGVGDRGLCPAGFIAHLFAP